MTIEAALDCGKLSLQQILDLQEGMIIRSQRPAGDNVDLHVGGRLIGYGEMVVLDGVMGVRITTLKDSQ